MLRFHLRLAYAVSKLLLRKFLVAALNQTRNQLGAALKTGTFRVAVHRLRPSIDLAGFSGVYLCFGRLGQPNSSRDNKALSFWGFGKRFAVACCALAYETFAIAHFDCSMSP